MDEDRIQRIVALDRAHVWHPFTPMRQWREHDPPVIVAGEGDCLIDARGRRYLDGVGSLWCNVHGHRVPAIDHAIRDQLDRIAHSTLLGLVNVPSAELAGRLAAIAPGGLSKVFYSDAGATATEVAFKMAVGHWHHRGQPQRNRFVALEGAYHGDTTGAMSIGYSDLFHRPFQSMVFHTEFIPPPEPRLGGPGAGHDAAAARTWPLEDPAVCNAVRDAALAALDARLAELGETVAAIVVEPLVQGAAGIRVQPPGYLRGVADLCRKHGSLLIADEVATGFGRTGRLFACEHEGVEPDLMALGKGLSGGYLPLAATLCTDEIAESFEGELHEFKTLYHGHTFTGNPLACAAALASIDLLIDSGLVEALPGKAERLARGLDPLRDPRRFAHVLDVRQRGLMAGIEIGPPGSGGGTWLSGDPSGGSELGDFGETPDPHAHRPRWAYEICDAARSRGVIVRPLGNVIVLMPPPAMSDAHLDELAAAVVDTIAEHAPE